VSLSRRVQRAAPSATLATKAEADRLRAAGVDLVDLGLGEPDFDTPEHVKEAARVAMRENRTHYTSVEGMPALRSAIAERYKARDGVTFGLDQIFAGSGAKGVLYAVIQALIDEGDEVAIFAPYWSSYPEQVKLAGGNPVIVPTREEDGFLPSAGALEARLTPKTRAVIVNSPCNPTGSVLGREGWSALASLAAARGLTVVCDEVYEAFVYDDLPFVSGAAMLPVLGDRLVIVSSLSKSYAMTGWRLGYALGPRELIGAAATVQAHDASQAPTLSQCAGLAALTGTQEPLRVMLAEYARRRAFLVPALQRIEGLACAEPRGAFYAFPRVTGLYGRLGVRSSAELGALLVREAGVVTVAGEGFGAPGYIRISYAASLPTIEQGVSRIEALVAGRA
jgi:aspartate aminotransferase